MRETLKYATRKATRDVFTAAKFLVFVYLCTILFRHVFKI